MVSSTNGDLGPVDESRLDVKAGTPLHAQQPPEVEVVEETKYVSIHFDVITIDISFAPLGIHCVHAPIPVLAINTRSKVMVTLANYV